MSDDGANFEKAFNKALDRLHAGVPDPRDDRIRELEWAIKGAIQGLEVADNMGDVMDEVVLLRDVVWKRNVLESE